MQCSMFHHPKGVEILEVTATLGGMKKRQHVQIHHLIVEFHQTFGGHYAMFNVRHQKSRNLESDSHIKGDRGIIFLLVQQYMGMGIQNSDL